MNYTFKKRLKKIILEKIKRIEAEKNPDNSKYPLTITAVIEPASVSNFNKSHKDYDMLKKAYRMGNVPHLLRKKVKFQGDYAKRGNTGVETLRLKILKKDWPDIWSFPETEIDRRLFLQNFRLSNLKMITPFDEGGEEYKKLFPPEPDVPVEIVFDEEESSESTEEEIVSTQLGSVQTNNDKIFEALEALDYLASEAREEGESDFAASISDVYMTLLRDTLKNKKKR